MSQSRQGLQEGQKSRLDAQSRQESWHNIDGEGDEDEGDIQAGAITDAGQVEQCENGDDEEKDLAAEREKITNRHGRSWKK